MNPRWVPRDLKFVSKFIWLVVTFYQSFQIRSKFETTTSPDENVTVSTYRFVPSTMDAGSQLVCRAGNVRLPDSTLEDSWRLKIHCKFRFDIKNRKIWFFAYYID